MKSRKGWISWGLLFLLACLGASAQAQKMYRCGNTYQDRPCAGVQQGKIIGSTGASQPAATLVADGPCAQRGTQALRIMWAKETGRTEEMQLAVATSGYEKQLIGEVYRKRGSSAEVRAAIEADCMAEMQRAAQAAALAEAAAKLQGQGVPAATVGVPAARPAPDPDAESRRQREVEARLAADKKARCDGIAARLENIRNSQRAGGNAATMDSLRSQQRKAEEAWSSTGC